MILLSNKRVDLFALGSVTLPNNHLTLLFLRHIAVVLSLRTIRAKPSHQLC